MQKAECRRQKFLLISAFCILHFAFASCSAEPKFLERKVAIDGHTYAYRVWLPPHYTKLHRWPVILFLHGSGESGDDNRLEVTVCLTSTFLKLMPGTTPSEKRTVSYAKLALKLDTTEAALRMAVSRMRQRYRELLLAEIANTVAAPEDVDEELRALFAALSN